jgi:predicted YcjX-like family ATPase
MATSITPDALKQAEEHWRKLRDSGDPGTAAAEAEFQRLARAQTDELRALHYKSLISRMQK